MGTPDIAATCLKRILADGFDVVGVNVLAFFNIANSVSDLLTVFYNVFAAFYVANGIFVPVFNINLNIIKFIY